MDAKTEPPMPDTISLEEDASELEDFATLAVEAWRFARFVRKCMNRSGDESTPSLVRHHLEEFRQQIATCTKRRNIGPNGQEGRAADNLANAGCQLADAVAQWTQKAEPTKPVMVKPVLAALRYFERRLPVILGEHDIRLVDDLEGEPFDIGMAVKTINQHACKSNTSLLVDRMIEPIVLGPSGVIRFGTVKLKEASS